MDWRSAGAPPLISVDQVEARSGAGLTRDHFAGTPESKRKLR